MKWRRLRIESHDQATVPDRKLEIGGKVGFHGFSLNPNRRDDGTMSGFNRACGAGASGGPGRRPKRDAVTNWL